MNSSDAHRLYTHIIAAANEVHSQLGPGLSKSAYIKCLGLEFDNQEIKYLSNLPVNLVYKGNSLTESLYIDLLVENEIIIVLYELNDETKFQELQLRSLLKLTNKKFGIVMSFRSERLLDGIKKIYSS